MSTRHSRPKGALLALLSATFWGLSGTVAQALFRESGITPEWFVVVRLLSSGALLLLFSLILKKRSGDLWSIWRNPRDRVSLMLFGLIGMLGVQYTYLVAIDKSNAATATFLQYLAPLFVVGALSLIERKWPRQMELLGVLLAIGGTFFLVTGGKGDGMAITVPAFLWGIASAITLAFYTLQPTYLLNRYESITIVGWGMLIGGFGFGLFHSPWKAAAHFSMESILYMGFIILFGTVFAFLFYIESMKHIRPSETSLFASMEPLTAAVASVLWLNVPFGAGEWFGAALILFMVLLLSAKRDQAKAGSENKQSLQGAKQEEAGKSAC